MSKNYDRVKFATLDFAARFGFVTKSIFFDYLCTMQKSCKYSSWKDLKRDGLIARSKALKDVCYLTKAGRRQAPRLAVPSRSIYFVEHDEMVARFYLELQKSGHALESWTAYELSRKPWEACGILGTADLIKIPDFVIDMKSKSSRLRIAFEMERSRKSGDRYAQMAFNYLGFKRVDLLLVSCANVATKYALERAFDGPLFRKAEKLPALFLADDFEELKTDAPTSYEGSTLSLKKLLLAALEQNEWGPSINVENPWNSFHRKLNDKKECA